MLLMTFYFFRFIYWPYIIWKDSTKCLGNYRSNLIMRWVISFLQGIYYPEKAEASTGLHLPQFLPVSLWRGHLNSMLWWNPIYRQDCSSDMLMRFCQIFFAFLHCSSISVLDVRHQIYWHGQNLKKGEFWLFQLLLQVFISFSFSAAWSWPFGFFLVFPFRIVSRAFPGPFAMTLIPLYLLKQNIIYNSC